jgi:G:T/U-mismatch repair DNA glycosylase
MACNTSDDEKIGVSSFAQGEDDLSVVETHPWKPFMPEGTRMILLGSFPPARHRWAMDFFYPNFINDMWRIFGICLHGDKKWFVDEEKRSFHRSKIECMLKEMGIGLYDTAFIVRRKRNTASDKDLEVIQATDLDELLRKAPGCRYVVTTGQKATDVFVSHFNMDNPKVGGHVDFHFEGRTISLYRMPSSSRAYPMKIEDKADCYMTIFKLLS